MHILQIHPRVEDFDGWKADFDRDPIGRAGNGVAAHRIARSADDPARVTVELDFADRAAAEAFRDRLTAGLRDRPQHGPAPDIRLLESMERHEYQPVT